MLELQTKIKRQIEILGLCIDNRTARRPVDLAVMFNCEELTIKRDLQELRSYGIDIHSVSKKGICVDTPIDQKKLKELIIQYIGLSNSGTTFDKATTLVIKQQKTKSLSNIVNLQRSIEQSLAVAVDYVKEEGDVERDREIWPLQIFQSEGYWRVLAMNEGRIKQYHLNKLTNVRVTDRKFKRVPQEQIDDMFRFSFRSWVGSEKHTIRIELSKLWAGRIKPRQLMESQTITEHEDGSVVFEATVNSLEEVASWVVSRGEGVRVLEPERLKEMVVLVARGALKNYNG